MFEDRNIHSAPVRTSLEPTFLGKVLSFFALAVLISAAGTYFSANYLFQYFAATPALMYIVFAVELILVFTSRMWSTRHPLNRIMFVAFAFVSGVTLGPLMAVLTASAAGMALLTKALLITGLMFSAAALFGWATKMDLSGMRGFLMFALIGMIVMSIVGIFIPWSNTTEIFFSGAGVLLFSGFIIYDINKLHTYPEDRYIDAALSLYLDIFNLFIYILRLLGALDRK